MASCHSGYFCRLRDSMDKWNNSKYLRKWLYKTISSYSIYLFLANNYFNFSRILVKVLTKPFENKTNECLTHLLDKFVTRWKRLRTFTSSKGVLRLKRISQKSSETVNSRCWAIVRIVLAINQHTLLFDGILDWNLTSAHFFAWCALFEFLLRTYWNPGPEQ